MYSLNFDLPDGMPEFSVVFIELGYRLDCFWGIIRVIDCGLRWNFENCVAGQLTFGHELLKRSYNLIL